MELSLNVFYERDGDWWCAYVPEVPGAVSQGRTLEEAREMVLDAVRELNLSRVEQALKEETPTRRETLSVRISVPVAV